MPPVLPMPPSSSSPPLPRSTVGTVTEGLVGLQLGGRKERKANQRKEDDPVFPHSAPLAPGTTGCPGTPISPPWDPCVPSPAARPHPDLLPSSPLRCHLGHTWTLMHQKPVSWQPAGTPGPPYFCPHPTSTRHQRGQVSACRGTALCTLV